MLRCPDSSRKLNEQVCPNCGARGNFKNHGYYKRSLVKLILGFVVDYFITIKRVRCCSCGKTHALIPIDVVPYCHHSITLVTQIFHLRFVQGHTIKRICEQLKLSESSYWRIYHRSANRLFMIASLLAASQMHLKKGSKIALLVDIHLKIHKLKPFESGRLYPGYFDP